MTDQNLSDRLNAGAAAVVNPGVSDGLVSKNGVPGNTTGSAIAAGYVGEVVTIKTASPVDITSATQAAPIFGSATLQKGIYAPYVNMRVVTTGTVTISESLVYGYSVDSSTTAWSDYDSNAATNYVTLSLVMGGSTLTATQTRWGGGAALVPIVVTAPTAYYFKSFNRVTSGTLTHLGFLSFVRIG